MYFCINFISDSSRTRPKISEIFSPLHPSHVEHALPSLSSLFGYTFYLVPSLARFLSISPFLSLSPSSLRTLRTSRPSFEQHRTSSHNVGSDFCCALCRTYKRMKLFPGPATCATLDRMRTGSKVRASEQSALVSAFEFLLIKMIETKVGNIDLV